MADTKEPAAQQPASKDKSGYQAAQIRALMQLAQKNPEMLEAVGFSKSDIAAFSEGKDASKIGKALENQAKQPEYQGKLGDILDAQIKQWAVPDKDRFLNKPPKGTVISEGGLNVIDMPETLSPKVLDAFKGGLDKAGIPAGVKLDRFVTPDKIGGLSFQDKVQLLDAVKFKAANSGGEVSSSMMRISDEALKAAAQSKEAVAAANERAKIMAQVVERMQPEIDKVWFDKSQTPEQQLQSRRDLLQKIHNEQCKALGVEPADVRMQMFDKDTVNGEYSRGKNGEKGKVNISDKLLLAGRPGAALETLTHEGAHHHENKLIELSRTGTDAQKAAIPPVFRDAIPLYIADYTHQNFNRVNRDYDLYFNQPKEDAARKAGFFARFGYDETSSNSSPEWPRKPVRLPPEVFFDVASNAGAKPADPGALNRPPKPADAVKQPDADAEPYKKPDAAPDGKDNNSKGDPNKKDYISREQIEQEKQRYLENYQDRVAKIAQNNLLAKILRKNDQIIPELPPAVPLSDELARARITARRENPDSFDERGEPKVPSKPKDERTFSRTDEQKAREQARRTGPNTNMPGPLAPGEVVAKPPVQPEPSSNGNKKDPFPPRSNTPADEYTPERPKPSNDSAPAKPVSPPAPLNQRLAGRGNSLLTLIMETKKVAEAPDAAQAAYLGTSAGSMIYALSGLKGSAAAGTVGSGMMVPLDVISAYDLAKQGKYDQATIKSISAFNSAVGTYAIATGSGALASSTLLIGLPIAAVVTNLEIEDIIEDVKKDTAKANKKESFKPGITAAFGKYFKDNFSGDPKDSRDKNGAPCPPGMSVRPENLPLPGVDEYEMLKKAAGFTGNKDLSPDALDAELRKQRAGEEKKIQDAMNNPLAETYSRPLFGSLRRSKIADLMKTEEGRIELRLKIAEVRWKDFTGLDNSKAEYDNLLKDLDTIDESQRKIKTIDGALIDLNGDKDGNLFLGQANHKVPSYRSRYNEIAKFKADHAKEMAQRPEILKKLEPLIPDIEKAVAANEEPLKTKRDALDAVQKFSDDKEGSVALSKANVEYLDAAARVKDLERYHKHDPKDRYAYAMWIKAKLDMQEKEAALLERRQEHIYNNILKKAEKNKEMASDPEFIAAEKELKQPVLAQTEYNNYQKISAEYGQMKEQSAKLLKGLGERFGDKEQQKKLLEAKDPEYLKAVKEIEKLEIPMLAKYSDMVNAEREFIEAQKITVRRALNQQRLDERIKVNAEKPDRIITRGEQPDATKPPSPPERQAPPGGRRIISQGENEPSPQQQPAQRSNVSPITDLTPEEEELLQEVLRAANEGTGVSEKTFDRDKNNVLDDKEKEAIAKTIKSVEELAKNDSKLAAALGNVISDMKKIAQKNNVSISANQGMATPTVNQNNKPSPGQTPVAPKR